MQNLGGWGRANKVHYGRCAIDVSNILTLLLSRPGYVVADIMLGHKLIRDYPNDGEFH